MLPAIAPLSVCVCLTLCVHLSSPSTSLLFRFPWRYRVGAFTAATAAAPLPILMHGRATRVYLHTSASLLSASAYMTFTPNQRTRRHSSLTQTDIPTDSTETSPIAFMRTVMLQRTPVRRSAIGVAVASAMHKGCTSTMPHTNSGVYYTARPHTKLAPLPAPTHPVSIPGEAQLREFKRFYEVVTGSRAATSLPPTPLGRGGSERIFNNEFLHRCPWQASCMELRERTAEPEKRVLSYGNIDFASLRKRSHRNAAAAGGPSPTTSSSPYGSYSNVEDILDKSNGESEQQQQQGPGLDVVHYYETSTPEGLAGYQQIAMQVCMEQLPGSCTNFSAEGGFAVWVVPHDEYIETLTTMGYLPE
ncbi:hypothetical protein, unknown function [Leishmania braziliensis MHOM/BR/75/M2904]|uniref:Uncharacterized protein n=1 Tax=Leishmania braziliensis TaxID=5660 RepID=A4H726_LEIBR|nr:hypothetical protein, unknown function [Leishmania braziliensis MHOM/BR/75/M2904]CAJ2468573.1 unnamed protein product [Leishmania braziliensis]CAM45581.1 hypothetical protein, unknown function [Leishmania braziliensis MHOM/BR/75/M2904]